MIIAKPWSGKDLKGSWEVTIKIDGVRCLWLSGSGAPNGVSGWYSRAFNPLYNLPEYDGRVDCEAYCGSFKTTIERIRAATKTRPIMHDQLFSLSPIDERLMLMNVKEPTASWITSTMNDMVAAGYEGLVLRQSDVWLKVKSHDTYDVPVTGMTEGTGKHTGRMGALVTPKGSVGTGFTDDERKWWWATKHGKVGTIIEVGCMKLTDDGKFRHPRFIRIRDDK